MIFKELLILAMFLIIFNNHIAGCDRMKLYTFYTPSHEILFSEWFLPTLQDDFDLVVEKYSQECSSGTYLKGGWGKTMLRKVDLIIRAIRENWGKIFVYADIDIQFFMPIKNLIDDAMKNKDIVFQCNRPSGEVCAGFLSCLGNEKTLLLWQTVKEIMIESNSRSDQKILNEILTYQNFNNLKWDVFSVNFFGAGTLTGNVWQPGDFLMIPSNICLHHANFTEGVANKIKQLEHVRERFNNL